MHQKHTVWLFVLTFVLACAFIGVFLTLPWYAVDAIGTQLMQGLQHPLLVGFMQVFSLMGNVVVLALATLGIFIWAHKKAKFWHLYSFIALLFASFMVAFLLKAIMHIPRPFLGQGRFIGYGFPSMHAVLALVFWSWVFAILYKEHPKQKWWWFLLSFTIILLVSLSRLVLYAHFISDILGGLLLGAFCFSTLVALEHALMRNWHLLR